MDDAEALTSMYWGVCTMKKSKIAKIGWQLWVLVTCLCGCHGTYYDGRPEEMALGWSLDRCGECLAGTHDMTFLFVGNVSYNHDVLYSLAFSSQKNLTLAEGRKLASDVTKEFWSMLQDSESVQRHLELLQSTNLNVNKEKVDLARVAFRIGFWDDDVNRPKPPSLAAIFLVNKMFYYYQADPETQGLRLVLKEPYRSHIALGGAS